MSVTPPAGYHRHANGGGLVQDTAHVDPTAYVGERACVYGDAQVYGDARVYGALVHGRRGIGIELKPTYFRQALKNLALADAPLSEQADFGFTNDPDADISEQEYAEAEDAA